MGFWRDLFKKESWQRDWNKLKKDLKQANIETNNEWKQIDKEKEWLENYWEPCPRCGSNTVETYRVLNRHKILLFLSALTFTSGLITGIIFSIVLGAIGILIIIIKFIKVKNKRLICNNCKNVWEKNEYIPQ